MPEADKGADYEGTVEVDETYMGGKRRNMSNAQHQEQTGRGPAGKTAVVGMKARETNRVSAHVVKSTDKPTLQGFVVGQARSEARVYTDETVAYEGLPHHESIKHGVSEYVQGKAHANGMESFWSMLKRAHTGTFHKLSLKHLDRYVQDFTDTLDQMRTIFVRLRATPCPTCG